MKNKPFENFDFIDFWDDDEYAMNEYIGAPPTEEMIEETERELGYKLPESYIWLMKQHNGGIPFNVCFPCDEPTSWADDHVAITGIMGGDKDKIYSLCGQLGSRFMIEEWGYPDIGVAICDCPSAGHDMIFLDYRECGPQGEPKVVHVDQEDDYYVTFLPITLKNLFGDLSTKKSLIRRKKMKEWSWKKFGTQLSHRSCPICAQSVIIPWIRSDGFGRYRKR